MKSPGRFFLALLAGALGAATASAHDRTGLAAARLVVRDRHVQLLLSLDVLPLLLPRRGSGEEERREIGFLATLSPSRLEARIDALKRRLASAISLTLDGKPIVPGRFSFPGVSQLRAEAVARAALGHGAETELVLEALLPHRNGMLAVAFAPVLGPVLVTYSAPQSRIATVGDTASFRLGAKHSALPEVPGTLLVLLTFALGWMAARFRFSLPEPSRWRVPAGVFAALALSAAVLLPRCGTDSATTAGCAQIQSSLGSYAAANDLSVTCDGTYASLSTPGYQSAHVMMDGITATNLQVPVAQNFTGANAWKIPLNPAVAAQTTAVDDGPVGIAVNGIPIFNPCKQGGCQNGDTKVLGELDVCNGHAGRADDYHYHAAPVCLMADQSAAYWDTHPIGWALDGFAIFGYHDADGTTATRDAVCGGNDEPVQNAPAGYSYHVTDTSPYVLSCLRGTPSPDLAGQGGKYTPLRSPPVTPFAVSAMTLTTDGTDGFQVLTFTSASSFTTTETGSDSYVNGPGTYRIRFRAVTGSALAALLALAPNQGKSACWDFQFVDGVGATTQPAVSYCR